MRSNSKKILIAAMLTGIVVGTSGAGYAGNVYAKESNAEKNRTETGEKERIYCVGSVSKVYVTAAVMQLVDRGLVELDEPVTTYIPDFTMTDARYTDITVRMLMDHTSGIPGTSEKNMFLYDDNYRDRDYLLESLSLQRLTHEPGEYAAYCNDGFDLLELIVENVTGTDYTEYVGKNIAAPMGATHTGSALTLFENERNAPIIFAGNVPYAYDYCMSIGAGGINATASDVANFGSAFFKENSALLSEKSKETMATRWNDEGENTDVYKDGNGLGWDYVESLAYEAEGVTVLGKGGDITNQHAFLLVAPEEEVSVAVLSAGGNSNYNELMAEALLDVVLKEQGITPGHGNERHYEFTDEVPEEYLAYEGFYVFSSFSGTSYAYVSFENGRMHVKHIDFGAEMTEDYRFTSDGSFVSVDENGVPTVDSYVGRFEANENGVYITVELSKQVPGLGTSHYSQYAAERVNPNPVSKEAVASWQKICGRDMVIFNERYSSTGYDRPFAGVFMLAELPGYIYVLTEQGGKTLKITDERNAVSFTTMPCSTNRDLVDVQIAKHTLPDGSFVTELKSTMGINYRFVDELPVLHSDVAEVSHRSDEVQWFQIGDDMAGSTMSADCLENSVIYVYNKYHEVVYSTHMLNADGNIPLPSDGYIMFAGEDDEPWGRGKGANGTWGRGKGANGTWGRSNP